LFSHARGFLSPANTNPDKVRALSKNLAFNLGGHTNHSVFWKNLSPNGGGEPTGDLAEAINRDFGSFDKFKAHFSAAAVTVDFDDQQIGTVGPPIGGMTVRTNGVGEILVKGPTVFAGYWNNEEATKEALHGEWYNTGDLGE